MALPAEAVWHTSRVIDLDGLKIPKATRPITDEIVMITDRVCADLFDDELSDLARCTVAKLARKRPSPLVRGTRRVWAAGVMYALAQVNFLFDPANKLHTSADDLSEEFGVAKSTMSSKAKQIRDMLKIDYGATEFLRADMIARSPFVWLIEVDGLMFDARTLPVEIQVQAYLRGFIPYVPALIDNPGESDKSGELGG